MAINRQKISQMTPKGSNLDPTDLMEVSVQTGSGYETRSITGQEIINAASGGALDLQAVTDNGNTTSNSIQVHESGDNYSDIYSDTIQVSNAANNTYSSLSSDGTISLKTNDYPSALVNNNVTNPNVILEFPNKTAGSYTIATTSDLTGGTVTSVGLSAPSAFNVTNSPVTGSGTLTLSGAGTTSQYIDGTGSLQTLPTGLPPTGTAGGDLNGTYPNPTVDGIHGIDMQSGIPTNGDVWVYGGSPAKWQHQMLHASQIDNDSAVTGTHVDDALNTLNTNKVNTSRTINTTSPLSGGGDLSADRTLSITDAAADGTTKGAATFTASDFNSAAGVISIDYTNGQAANGSNKGFLTSADWTTFNNKVSTGAITGSGLTLATNRLLGRTTAGSGAVEEISIGTGLTLSGGTLSSTGGGLTIGTTAITSGTVGRILFEGTGNVVQEDSALFWDNTNKRLGVGTSTPLSPLELYGSSAGVTTPLQIRNTLGGGNAIAAIKFTNTASTAFNAQNWAWIGSKRDATLAKGRLVFAASDNIANDPSTTDIGMVLGFDKSLLIGIDGIAGARLDVRAQGALSTDIAFRVRNSADTGNHITVYGNDNVSIGRNGSASAVLFVRSANSSAHDVFNLQNGLYGDPLFRIRDNATGSQTSTCSFFMNGRIYGGNTTTKGTEFDLGGFGIGASYGDNGNNAVWLNNQGNVGDGSGSSVISVSSNFYINKQTTKVYKFEATSGNFGIGQMTFGTSATNTIAIANGTAPTTSPSDAYQQYSADITAGNAAPHFRTENGAIVKVYQETTAVAASTLVSNAGTAITDTDTFDGYTLKQIVKALRNQGLLA